MVGKIRRWNRDPAEAVFREHGRGAADQAGSIEHAPPGQHAGNLDNKELVAGTTLFIPVHARGALFSIGDGHELRATAKSASPPWRLR